MAPIMAHEVGVEGIRAGVAMAAIILIFYIVRSRRVKSVTMGAGRFSAKVDMSQAITQRLDELATSVAEINKSVNNKKDHEPTLVERTRTLEHNLNWIKAVLKYQSQCFEELAKHVGLDLPECIGCQEADHMEDER